MSPLGVIFLLFTGGALLTVPRRWAPLPMLLGACYMTLGQGLQLGPFSFTVIRLLILLGTFRVVTRGELPRVKFNIVDRVMLLWAAWAVISSIFHEPFLEALVSHMGFVYDTLGAYFLLRAFCQTEEDRAQIIKYVAILLLPVTIEMLSEQITGRNLFALLGGIDEAVEFRAGKFRAQGPFGHSILAGTVGAACFPLMIGLWRKNKTYAKIGLAATLGMVITCASSGPLMSVFAAIFALLVWRWKHLTRQMRIGAVFVYILLDMIMKAPAYYIISRIDLTGSSTGWHRARLIESTIEHFNEWWFAGTDVTRHWMPTGVAWNEAHTDITNHYIKMGVRGGLPLMLLFMWLLWVAFARVGKCLRADKTRPEIDQFMIWSIGAALFTFATAFVSISIFDQSFIFLYMLFAMISSLNTDGSTDKRISS